MHYFLTIIFFLLASTSFSQDMSQIMDKGSRIVYVKNDLSAEQNFMAAGSALVALEYGISNTQKLFGFIESNIVHVLSPASNRYLQQFTIVTDDNLIKIYAKEAVDNSGSSSNRNPAPYFAPVTYNGVQYGSNGLFQGLLNIADKLEGEIWFAK